MTDLRKFELLKVNEISVKRHGFFLPWFEVTDGQFCYGKLSYQSVFKRCAVLETADGKWFTKIKGFTGKTLLIQQPEGETLGMAGFNFWIKRIKLVMNNGFEATFTNNKVLSCTHAWNNDLYGSFIAVKANIWSYKFPFKVNVGPVATAKTIPEIPLLTILGANLILHNQFITASHTAS